MRKARDGESTKEAVLTAAKQVFAERGFAGSSLAMISKKCGISDGLILHHYKNKQNLYHEVLEDLAKGYLETVFKTGQESHTQEQMIDDVLRATFKFWSEDTIYNRISLWAFLENQTELLEKETNITASLTAVVGQMQMDGKADPRVDPVTLLTMTIGPIHFWTRYRNQFKETLQLDGTIEELNQSFLEQFLILIQKVYQVENKTSTEKESE
ncbi:MAG: TetR/AcrR family transcriptional regulator [Anaerolineales bacterium]|nr:TetR/AcrR family transcriptional regulator [Anaerolineales bacterium]